MMKRVGSILMATCLLACREPRVNTAQQTPSSTTNGGSGNSPDNASGKYNLANICTLLSRAEAETLLGKPLLKEPEATLHNVPQSPLSCMYRTQDGPESPYVQVLLYQAHDAFTPQGFYTSVRDRHELTYGTKPELVSGIGEQAFFSVNALNVLSSGYLLSLQVGAPGDFQKEKTRTLAGIVLPRLR